MMRKPYLLIVGLFVLAPAVATAAGQRKNQPDSPREEVSKQGKISVVRTIGGSQARLTDDKDKHWKLTGAFARELRRLSGHVVKVWGVASEGRDKPQRSVAVRRYAIIDAGGGKKPLVGVLRLGSGKKLQLVRKDDVVKIRAKKALVKRLRRRLGCKIWIVGTVDGDTIDAYKFGRLTCRKPKPIKPRKETRK